MGSNQETTSTLEIRAKLPPEKLAALKQDLGDFLVEQITKAATEERSPVAGESWPKLSKAYGEHKKKLVGDDNADLRLSGDMIADLMHEATDDGLKIGWVGDQAAKADGHANLSGKSQIPTRRVIPDKGQEFDPAIMNEMEKMVIDALGEEVNVSKQELEMVHSKADLYELLEEYFDGLSRAEIASAVLRNPDLMDLLDEVGVLDFL